MKNRDLIRLLQMLEPDDEVTFDVGTSEWDKDHIAKAALFNCDMLDFLTIQSVTLVPIDNGLRAEVTLWQESTELSEASKRFYEDYKEIEDE